jgi:hypothetical protein
MKVELRFSCGCGHPVKTMADAEEHVNRTGHRMEIHGSLQADFPVPRKVLRLVRLANEAKQ